MTLIRDRLFGLVGLIDPCPPPATVCPAGGYTCPLVDRVELTAPPAAAGHDTQSHPSRAPFAPDRGPPPPGDVNEPAPSGWGPRQGGAWVGKNECVVHANSAGVSSNTAPGTLLDVFA